MSPVDDKATFPEKAFPSEKWELHSNLSQNPFRPAQHLVTHADHKDLELEDSMLRHLGQICRSNLDGTAPLILQLQKPQQTKQALVVQPA